MDFENLWQDGSISRLIDFSLEEDLDPEPHSSLSAIPKGVLGKAKMIAKEDGIIAGLPISEVIFQKINPKIKVNYNFKDGDAVKKGDLLLTIEGEAVSILSGERLVLNFIQRMSGIATVAKKYSEITKPYDIKILDTRKTTPGLRLLEKYAVKVGGAENHRMGLFDMIMLKDNHIDFCGGITKAIKKTQEYQKEKNLNLKVEVETRNIDEVREVCSVGGVDRIMLDNFHPNDIKEAVELIAGKYEIELSGGITLDNIKGYLFKGVDFISIGALTHSVKSLDISLKTKIEK